ncbi:MAG: nucleotidyl transferase AbiEii/AbiGii toxin family protein [Candidatus Micrarchaeota archaeon]
MIDGKELASMAISLGLNSYQAEKDYLQHAFLASLYAVSSSEFIFKGGTALQKAYALDRFSEDLDFTFSSHKEPSEIIEKAVAELGKFALCAISKKEQKPNSISAKLKVNGPLYQGNEISVQTIVLEISMREEVLRKALAVRIVPPYLDLRPYVALCMDLNEMLAEKVRAIIARDKPRDVYDAWFMTKKNAKFDLGEINQKLGYYGKKFEFSEFKQAIARKERIWKTELSKLMRNPPDFDEVSAGLLLSIKAQLGSA